MIVCQCLGMNENGVLSVLKQLPDPASATVDEVIRACGAGGDCTKCVPLIQSLIDDNSTGNSDTDSSNTDRPKQRRA